jgi:hypothetical protein
MLLQGDAGIDWLNGNDAIVGGDGQDDLFGGLDY